MRTGKKSSVTILSRALAAAIAICCIPTHAAPSDGNTLTLDDAKRLALENSPVLRAESENVGIAQSVVTEARANYLPAISTNITAAGAKSYGTRNDAIASSTLQPRVTAGALNASTVLDRAAAGVTVSQLLTDFGRTGNLVEGAKASLSAAQNSLEDRRQRVLLQVTEDYYRALEAQSTLQVTRKTLDDRKALFDQISLLQKNKLRSELDVNFSGVNLEQAKLLVLEAQNAVDASIAQLADTIGLQKARFSSLADDDGAVQTPVADADPLIQEALSDRPELKSLHDQVLAAEKNAKAERALSYPVLSAVGAAGTTPYGDDRIGENYAAGGVNLNIPMFEGGRLNAQYREAVFKAQQTQDVLNTAEIGIARDVRIAWLNATAGYKSLDVSEKLRATADSALELAESRYHLGLSSIVELNAAQLNAIDADISAVRARYEYKIAQARLSFQLGKL
jgi:outer membrane protein